MPRGLLLIWMAFLVAGAARAGAPCQMEELGELPVTFGDGGVGIEAQIDGQPVRMIVDTGSAATLLTRPAAQQLGLPLRYIDGLKQLYGVGGKDVSLSARIKEFKVAAMVGRDFDMLVTSRHGLGAAQGVLGTAFLMQADVEFDFPDGKLRFFRPGNCQGDQVVYWGKAYAVVPMVGSSNQSIDVTVLLNGKPIPARMDTGSNGSIVPAGGAANAGVEPTQDGAAVFASFAFGDETIHNARLRVADMFHDDSETEMNSPIAAAATEQSRMLLGEDFFRSHRVYVSRGQRKVYVSYVGGPVFASPAP